MTELTLAAAQAGIAAAIAQAKLLGILESVSVVNNDCRPVAFARMNGSILAGVYGSAGKAIAAAAFNSGTDALETRMGAGPWVQPPQTSAAPLPVPTLPGVAEAVGGAIYAQGGEPVVFGGMVIGAVGCGGSSSANDQTCAQAGAAAIVAFLNANPGEQ